MTDLLPSDDALREQAVLVARGVRPLALVGSCVASEAATIRHRLLTLTAPGALPFAIADEMTTSAMYGYASHAWVVDLLRWADHAPMVQRDRIIGLLLGYSADAIRNFEEIGITIGPFDQEGRDGTFQDPQPVPEVRLPRSECRIPRS